MPYAVSIAITKQDINLIGSPQLQLLLEAQQVKLSGIGGISGLQGAAFRKHNL